MLPNKKHVVTALGVLALLALPLVSAADQSVNLRLSVGSSWQTRNDVQIPNTNLGTRFSLEEAVGAGPVPAARLEINWAINERHGMRVLLAPLSYTEPVSFDQDVLFNGERFSAGQTTDATYKFNSWRLGYHYTLVNNEVNTFRVGGTIKIRDAEIRLEQGDTVSANDNIGFVPLLYLAGSHQLNDRWRVGADLDGLAGGPGRAIDLGVSLTYALSSSWQVGAELRVLDGGADTDEVFNFAQLASAAVVISTGF